MSENIFTELYNKILSLFGQSVQKEDSKDLAVNRLRVVLMQDRTNLTPELLQRMRKELIDLLSKYVEMDKEALELNFEQDGEQMALMLSIPVVRAKDEEEIEAALKAEKDKEESEEEEESEDETDDEEDDLQDVSDEDSDDEDEVVEDDAVEKNDESDSDVEENASEKQDSTSKEEQESPSQEEPEPGPTKKSKK